LEVFVNKESRRKKRGIVNQETQFFSC